MDLPENYLSFVGTQASEQGVEGGFIFGICFLVEFPLEDPVSGGLVLEFPCFGLVRGESFVGEVLNYEFSLPR